MSHRFHMSHRFQVIADYWSRRVAYLSLAHLFAVNP